MLEPTTTLFETAASVGEWRVLTLRLAENLSQPYLATVELHQPEETGDDPALFLGASCVVTVARGDAVEHRTCGVVREVVRLGVLLGHVRVRLELVPALALLDQRQDSRIFQEMDATEILKAVLEGGLKDYDRSVNVDGLSRGAYPKREYEVQYQESDFHFASRLMQEEGISYTFTHDGDNEELVLFDNNDACADCLLVSGDDIPILAGAQDAFDVEAIQSFELSTEDRPTSIVVRDFDWTQPQLDMTREARGTGSQDRDRELYLTGPITTIGEYAEPSYGAEDGQDQATLRQESELARGPRAEGTSNVTGLRPGLRFTIVGHVDDSLDAEYIILRARHEAVGERDARIFEQAGDFAGNERYRNTFDCIPADVVIRPRRMLDRCRVLGPQTATVVGPAGEEIHTDEHGRVKVQFHWDREGKKDENSSCWVRVMQTWAGPGFGTVFIPRLGMEAIVHFGSGEPSRPMVTGCVYNGSSPPPHKLPDDKTKATIFTNSSIGGGGWNEVTFEDAKGSEQLYLQAQKNMDTLVKADQTLKVGGNRDSAIDGNETLTVAGNRDTEVSGSRTTHIAGSQTTTIDSDESKTVAAGQTVTISGGQKSAITGGQTITVNGGQTVSVVGGRKTEISGFDKLTVNSPHSRAIAGPFMEKILGPNDEDVKADKSEVILGVWCEAVAGAVKGKTLGGKVENVAGTKDKAVVGVVSEQAGGIKKEWGEPTEKTVTGAIRCMATKGLIKGSAGQVELKGPGVTFSVGGALVEVWKSILNSEAPQIDLDAGSETKLTGSEVKIDAPVFTGPVIKHPDFEA